VKAEKIGPEGHLKWYANVDEFMAYFNPVEGSVTWLPGGSTPTPGDLIFFDWDKGTNPEHVGVVIEVKTVKIGDQEKTVIYTIEGNSSGRVAIRSYTLGDKRIIGYGILFET
jgi:cell wall-associated NlpC family hydrolase